MNLLILKNFNNKKYNQIYTKNSFINIIIYYKNI